MENNVLDRETKNKYKKRLKNNKKNMIFSFIVIVLASILMKLTHYPNIQIYCAVIALVSICSLFYSFMDGTISERYFTYYKVKQAADKQMILENIVMTKIINNDLKGAVAFFNKSRMPNNTFVSGVIVGNTMTSSNVDIAGSAIKELIDKVNKNNEYINTNTLF